MSSEIERLRRLLADAEQQLATSQQQLSASQQQSSKTNLPTFLDGLHKHLFLNLGVQPDKTQSTRGDPANAANKLRPRKLRAWSSFASEQEKIWQLLMDCSLMEDKLFTSLRTLEEMGENIRRQRIGSELDLNHFLRQTVEDHVSRIIEELYKDRKLRRTFGLRGSIRFENHSNTLSPEQELEEGLKSMDIRGRSGRRRSPRLAAREKTPSSVATSEPKTPRPIIKRPRADQFCVYNIPNESSESTHRVAAYIKEYKSPHKVTLGHIYEGLGDIDVDEVIQQKDGEPLKARFQRALVGLLSQPFDYMVRAGTQVGVFSTGEADIYLRIGDDPSTLFYHLSVPKGDVGEETGWDSHSDCPNRLHLTAVGQSLAFTLQALCLRPRNQAWGLQAIDILPKWEIILADILGDISEDDVPSSDYRPPNMSNSFVRSPVQLRRRRRQLNTDGCRPSSMHSSSEDGGDDPNTPSRGSHIPRGVERRQREASGQQRDPAKASSFREDNHRRYCTLKCLRGLVKRGVLGRELDRACPNVIDHGKTKHVLTLQSFLKQLQRQLSETVNADCEMLGIHGSRGALLKVTLSSHGYTVPAKCTVPEFRDYLRHEAAVYNSLRPIQGIYVPLYLGSIDLVHPYSYDGIAYLEHMMLLSPGGVPLEVAFRGLDQSSLISKLKESLSAIHNQNVIHKDPAPRNWLYNPESKKVVIFDFERAEIINTRPILTLISPNRKRKLTAIDESDQKSLSTEFAREINRAVRELRGFRLPLRPQRT
ncbi:hypothetical protein N7457_002726 [Penicillium paradoxum]|uniref:uncharacterized protein n=1 Tax=Penicillium paradoxum TaxID=176176 RepID=UPI0025495B95|nr:uncharacterized protein N7457_002726 [Penicillium paradoxum]KAJ5787736.1 hypothetical protein N7457_002726 [Penicillium paradoxum]